VSRPTVAVLILVSSSSDLVSHFWSWIQVCLSVQLILVWYTLF